MDFAVISSGGMLSSEAVDMVFGESKSGAALKEDERLKLKAFAERTGSYICFCTMADDFDETDKAFFRDLVDADIKIIMLTRFLLEMDYFEVMKYSTENNPGRSRIKSDWLMRATILRTRQRVRAQTQYLAVVSGLHSSEESLGKAGRDGWSAALCPAVRAYIRRRCSQYLWSSD